MSIQFNAIDTNNCRTITMSDGEKWDVPATIELPEQYEFFSLANANARVLLELLGLEFDYCGEVTIPEARRAVMGARARFARKAPELTREGSDTPAGSQTVVVREGGVTRIERRGPRIIVGGLDQDYLARRLNDFAGLVEAAASAGANALSWG